MSAAMELMEWGAERVRTGTWRGRNGIAYLTPVPGGPAPSPSFVDRCVASLAERGYDEVITGALAPAEQRGFLAAGFEVREHLVLLAHDLLALPPVSPSVVDGRPVRLRRARRGDRPVVLDVDHAAFRDFWRLDDAGLDEAVHATPTARFRVAVPRGGGVVGYAVTGRAGRHGYLQRLAVRPDVQRRGLARALVLDGLHWLARHDAARVLVNTQPDNDPALELYRSLGFRRQAGGLDVLGRRLAHG